MQVSTISQSQFDREKTRENSHCADLWDLLDKVKDPEIPVISIWDLGVLKDIQQQNGRVTVTITPTYSGCPAMDVIREDIEAVLNAYGTSNCVVKIELSPAWTTDWMTAFGSEQLRQYGIAPPNATGHKSCSILNSESQAQCPHCDSNHTKLVSEFSSTACKALFQCNDCLEPFDYFKCI